MSKTLTITISDEQYNHLTGDACAAGQFKPCVLSEGIVENVWYAANGVADEEEKMTEDELDEAARIDAGEAKFERETGR